MVGAGLAKVTIVAAMRVATMRAANRPADHRVVAGAVVHRADRLVAAAAAIWMTKFRSEAQV